MNLQTNVKYLDGLQFKLDWSQDKDGNIRTLPVLNEKHTINPSTNKIQLKKIPATNSSINIIQNSSRIFDTQEIIFEETTGAITNINQFTFDREYNLVEFHPDVKGEVLASYDSIGQFVLDINNIVCEYDSNGNVKEYLSDLIAKCNNALANIVVVGDLSDAINQIQAYINSSTILNKELSSNAAKGKVENAQLKSQIPLAQVANTQLREALIESQDSINKLEQAGGKTVTITTAMWGTKQSDGFYKYRYTHNLGTMAIDISGHTVKDEILWVAHGKKIDNNIIELWNDTNEGLVVNVFARAYKGVVTTLDGFNTSHLVESPDRKYFNNQHATNLANNTKEVLDIKGKLGNITKIPENEADLKSMLESSNNGDTITIPNDITVYKDIVIRDKKNLIIKSNFTIKIGSGYNLEGRNYISPLTFVNCENIILDLNFDNMATITGLTGMSSFVRCVDCKNIIISDIVANNLSTISGIQSVICCINQVRANDGFTVKKMRLDNCRSAVFSQYKNNVVTNVVAYNTSDAIIAFNTENCINNLVDNCVAYNNTGFPLVAIENMAKNTTVRNSTVYNCRGLVEVFNIEDENVFKLPNNYENIVVDNCKMFLNNESFQFNPTVTLMFARLHSTKYKNIIIKNSQLINTTTKNCFFLNVLSATNDTTGELIKYENIKLENIDIVGNDKTLVYNYINSNVKNVEFNNVKVTSKNKYGRVIFHNAPSLVIDNILLDNCIFDNCELAIKNDTVSISDTIYTNMVIKNCKIPNTTALCQNVPIGNRYNAGYEMTMYNNEYTLTNKGTSRLTTYVSGSITVGKWYKGDIVVNLNNNENRIYDGTNWIIRSW